MGNLKVFLAIGLIMLSLGCAAKKQVGINLEIPITALTKPVELRECDLNVDPPKCKKAVVSYKKSQAVIVTK